MEVFCINLSTSLYSLRGRFHANISQTLTFAQNLASCVPISILFVLNSSGPLQQLCFNLARTGFVDFLSMTHVFICFT